MHKHSSLAALASARTTLTICGSVAIATMSVPANAQQLASEIGGSAAQTCSEAALSGRSDPGAFADCDLALSQPLLTSDRAGTLVNRGILFMRAGRPDLSVHDYDEAITLDPAQPEAWLNKAVTMVNAGKGVAAVDLANRALQLRTERPAIAYYVRGLAHEEQGQVQDAYADLRNAAALAPQWAEPADQLRRYRIIQR